MMYDGDIEDAVDYYNNEIIQLPDNGKSAPNASA
jgi:hypothetical protein